MDTLREFSTLNAGYVLELYERYQRDPESVDASTRAAFERWSPVDDAPAGGAPAALARSDAPHAAAVESSAIAGAVNLANAIREYGHLAARLDPLGSLPRGDPWLHPAAHGITDDDLRRLSAAPIGGSVVLTASNAFDAIEALRTVYCGTIGYDYDHVTAAGERDWLRLAAEARRFRPPTMPLDPVALLDRMTQVEAFEQFLHRMFPGKTRFSLEGLDLLVPMLDEIIEQAGDAGLRAILMGMAHRGRLNVLAHVLNKPYAQILAEFKDPIDGRRVREDLGWTGDVTYHKGARRAVTTDEAGTLVVTLAPNPSHLEAVNAVVEGMAYAAGTLTDRAGPPRSDSSAALPILIHGDTAFPGQGIVAETLNLSRLSGHTTGGTIHLIANNQLGFTTEPSAGRSTLYASDVAKGFEMPVVHVNADDPEACIEAARLAFAYRAQFHKDFVIDLIGYRRYGHNEGDEPSFTQPGMYARIQTHPTVRALWARALVERKAIEPDRPDRLVADRMQALMQTLESLEPQTALREPHPSPPPPGAARKVMTGVSVERLRAANDGLLRVPEGFTVHPKLERPRERRRRALDDLDTTSIDWATAEVLALATILEDGVPVRLTGQDVARGTFSQRHALLRDARADTPFVPLQVLPQARAAFDLRDSPLSELAALGFEYGYNVTAPGRLVIWEAQYGDFINGAQVVLDEFITSGRAKWGQTPSLVILLPHGHEGQGPDHSSGRPERILQLAAEVNMRVANCTTAAQYFHLLRRQAALLGTDPLPLFIFTPKSLLRHPMAASPPRDLAEGEWSPVLDDPLTKTQRSEVRRVILCTGKVSVDLMTMPYRSDHPEVAIVRIEQLYLFPLEDLRRLIDGYPRIQELVWVQEEPENMGALSHVLPHLQGISAGRWPLRVIARPANASPAEGSAAWHAANQARLIASALGAETMVQTRS